MTGHTKGPWRAERYVGREDSWFIRGPNNEHVAGRGTTIKGADAHLIAAAPGLFEALDGLFAAKDAIAEFEREHPGNYTRAWDDLFYVVGFAEDAARAVLAKAKGETQ